MKYIAILTLMLLGCVRAEATARCNIPQPLCPSGTHYECHGDTIACGTCEPGEAHSCPDGYVLRGGLCFENP